VVLASKVLLQALVVLALARGDLHPFLVHSLWGERAARAGWLQRAGGGRRAGVGGTSDSSRAPRE
jgi:hypothetical protein